MKKKPVDRRWINYKNRAVGEHGQDLVKVALLRLGFRMVERVHTPWKPVRGAGGRVVHAFPVEKVSGDFRAIEPKTGRSVLVEVKTNDNPTLQWSDFEIHQIAALNENHEAKGLSIAAWVRKGNAHLMEWPIQGFGPGKSLKHVEGNSADAVFAGAQAAPK